MMTESDLFLYLYTLKKVLFRGTFYIIHWSWIFWQKPNLWDFFLKDSFVLSNRCYHSYPRQVDKKKMDLSLYGHAHTYTHKYVYMYVSVRFLRDSQEFDRRFVISTSVLKSFRSSFTTESRVSEWLSVSDTRRSPTSLLLVTISFSWNILYTNIPTLTCRGIQTTNRPLTHVLIHYIPFPISTYVHTNKDLVFTYTEDSTIYMSNTIKLFAPIDHTNRPTRSDQIPVHFYKHIRPHTYTYTYTR